MKPSKADFRERFGKALLAAIETASDKVPASQDQIELHFHGVQDCDFAATIAQLFIDDEHFFKVIDVSVHPKRVGWFFVRPSGHDPDAWEETLNTGLLRPFSVMVPA